MSSANAAALRSVTVGAWPVAMAVDARTERVFVVSNMPEGLVSILDAASGMVRWTEIAREAQQATLDLWQAGVGAGDKMLGSAASGEMSGQDDRARKR